MNTYYVQSMSKNFVIEACDMLIHNNHITFLDDINRRVAVFPVQVTIVSSVTYGPDPELELNAPKQ